MPWFELNAELQKLEKESFNLSLIILNMNKKIKNRTSQRKVLFKFGDVSNRKSLCWIQVCRNGSDQCKIKNLQLRYYITSVWCSHWDSSIYMRNSKCVMVSELSLEKYQRQKLQTVINSSCIISCSCKRDLASSQYIYTHV